VGTFLAQPKIVSEPTISGSLGNTLAASVDHSRISTKLLDLTRVHPSANLAAALLRTETDYLWQVRRQRLLDDDPIMLETALIPVELAPDLDKYRLALVGSFYELLANQYKLEDDYEEQYLEVVSPSLEERQLLKLTPRAQVVRIRGLSVDTSGTPFDCFEQVYPAANFMFGMLGSTSRRLLLESASLGWYVRPLPPSPPGDAAANTKDGSPAFRKSENQ
jgi:GntR family transcriptional regulator